MKGVKTVVGHKHLDVKAMSEEERLAYIERKRELNRNHVKKHYYEVVKADFEMYCETRRAAALWLAETLEQYKHTTLMTPALWTSLGRVVAALPPDSISEYVHGIRPHKSSKGVNYVDPVVNLVDHALN